MTTFNFFPPEPKELFLVVGTDDYEGLTFAQCTDIDLARRAVLMIETAGITSVEIIKDKLGLNRVNINGKKTYLSKKDPEFPNVSETPITEEQWSLAKQKAEESFQEDWHCLDLLEKEQAIWNAHNQLLQQNYGIKK